MQEAVEKSALGRVDLFQTLPQGERGAVNSSAGSFTMEESRPGGCDELREILTHEL